MKLFMIPEVVIEKFAVEDVITTSTGGSIGGNSDVGGGEEES